MKRAAIYARVSTWEQALKGYSLEYQVSILPDVARSRGYTVEESDIFSEVLSGAKDDRPQYNKMIAMILEGYYQAVFVVEKSRLSRTDSRLEEERVVKSLQRCGCVVITPHSTYDPSTLEGEFLWDILSAVDRNERKRIKVRNARGKYMKASKGEFCGGSLPTGYVKQWNKKSGRINFVIDEDKMKPVRLAFQWIQEGELMFRIAKRLEAIGYKTINGSRIRHHTIKYWLSNPHYAGYTHLGGAIYSKSKEVHIFDVNNYLEPIVTKEEFAKVQEIIDKRLSEIKARRQPPNRHPLNGLIICPNCQGRMSVDVRNKSLYQDDYRWYYRCNSRYSGKYCLGELPKTVPYNIIHLMLLDMLPELEKFGYEIDKNELDEFISHIVQDAPIQQLEDSRINHLKEIFNHFLKRVEYTRTGTSWHNYQYSLIRLTTTSDQNFIVNQYGELQAVSMT